MPITPAENFRRLLDGRGPRWIPFTLDVGCMAGFTAPILERFRQETGREDPAEHFDHDFRAFSLKRRFGGDDPAALHDDLGPGATFDEWGAAHWAGGAEGTPNRRLPPLAKAESVRDVEALPAPIIEPPADLRPLNDYRRRGYPVIGYAGSVYEWSWFVRGMDQFMMDLILRPRIAEAVVAKVADFTAALAVASLRAGVEVLAFYDDAGMQTGLQISPEHWRRFIKPAWRRVLDAARAEAPGCVTFLHSCGDISEILPDIADLGFSILHPVQPECMDPAEVRRRFGRDVVLCATISSQKTLPFGSPQEVRAEVRRLKALFADDGRAILCPSNMIQPETPWENILALAAEGRAGRRA